MPTRRNKVGKGKARKRSTPPTKRGRPSVARGKLADTIKLNAEEQAWLDRSPVKSPPSEPELEKKASAILDKLDRPITESAELRNPAIVSSQRDTDGLTTRRRRFIEEYLISGNGTQAAILAGYSANRADVEASELLKDAIIAAEISRRQAELNKKLQITQERVLAERAAIAFSDIGEIMGESATGACVVLPFRDWSPAARKAIRTVKVKRVIPKKDEAEQPFEILEFGLWDKPSGLDTIERRLDSEKGANAGVDLANLSDKERLRIIAEVLSRGRAARDAVLKGKKKTA